MTNNTQAIEHPFAGEVLQGYLEKSNVSAIDEMVDMIQMYRGFESDQKVINAYDQIMQKAANEIGKI
jgi:flagellar basal body and hook protein